jgi:hypothetical protein
MSEIYRMAKQAVVWLGEGNRATDRAIKRLHLMEEDRWIARYGDRIELRFRPNYYLFRARKFLTDIFDKLAIHAVSSPFTSVWKSLFGEPIDISMPTPSIIYGVMNSN